MKTRQIDLQIKIASLAEESRIIRRKEILLKYESFKLRYKSIGKAKGLDAKFEAPPELETECKRRCQPQIDRLVKAENWGAIEPATYNTARKAVRKWFRAGLTKEEILALPGVQKSLQYTAKVQDLHRHRTYVVRHESRHSQLAYAFLRGKPYGKAEDKAKSYPNWDKIQQIATRFSEDDKRVVAQKFEQWRQEANSLLRGNELMALKRPNAQPFKINPINVS